MWQATRRFLKSGLIGLFLSLLLLGGITAHIVMRMQSNGRLINYVGIVRGATQRLVKRELAHIPSDDLIVYLDEILLELNGAEGSYGLPLPSDRGYQEKLGELTLMWEELKARTLALRGGEDGAALLALSEDYFELANETVFAAEEYAAGQTRTLLVAGGIMLGLMLLTWLFIFWAYSQKMLSLAYSNKQLQELARRDPLTGVFLLGAFKETAQKLLDSGGSARYAIVYTDFADFKYVNDVFGYDYGDSILSRYGEILTAGLGEGELAGRVSADNFVLLLRYRDRAEIAERQRRADREITEFMHSSSGQQFLPSYCGICCVEDVVETLGIDGLMDRANFARKTVKNGANANYAYYNDSIRQRLWAEKNIENRMLDALERREFKVYYQPKVDLKTDRIACAEALVRWQAADGTIVRPDQFIPVFERKLLINRLDQYVFEEVCRWLRHLLDEGKPVLPVSVNVSRLQFYDGDFIARYVEIRDAYRIPPGLLEVEFTESIAFDNTNRLSIIVDTLRRAGFACSIDDFGKGYSSLSLLKSLPIDVLKIDSFFFLEGSNPERDMAVVQSIVELVRKFGIRTVAEGIETMEQVAFLKRIGCDYVQGYVFYRPMPQSDYETLLTERTKDQPG